MKKVKVYGETFLTKVRFTTHDKEHAVNSFFVWGAYGDECRLTLVGIINGFLSKIGYVLCLDVDTYGIIHKTFIKRKWWKNESKKKRKAW